MLRPYKSKPQLLSEISIVYHYQLLFMNVTEGLIIGLSSLFKNRMRSLLTMLGIIIGISGVVGTVSIGSGARKLVLTEFERIGASNEVAIWRRDHIKQGNKWVRANNTEYLENEDAVAIAKNCPDAKTVHTEIGPFNANFKYQDKDKNAKIIGTVPVYQLNRNWFVDKGRFISDEDVSSGAKVCVIGSKVWDELCGKRENAIGDEIKINGIRFAIIGVMQEKGNTMASQGWDDTVFMPVTTVQGRMTNNHYVWTIHIQARSFEQVDDVENQAMKVLEWRHKDAHNVFDTWTAKKEIKNVEKVSMIIKGLLGGVASIALLVGGIGVMNIMLVSVTERTWEIGLRKAVGAKRRDILLQFLMESAVISVAGGIIGILAGVIFGVGGAKLFSMFVAKGTDWPSVVSIQSIIIATSVSFIIGIVFGLYPANRAARLMPTEALRQK
ncbi:MAG: ABC transporter permease, partial [Candidatus Poribacteria bacterium]